jgi:hypothetical protein
MREMAGAAVYGYYRPDPTLPQQAAREARAALGDDHYDDRVDNGRALDLDDAVGYALAPASLASTPRRRSGAADARTRG